MKNRTVYAWAVIGYTPNGGGLVYGNNQPRIYRTKEKAQSVSDWLRIGVKTKIIRVKIIEVKGKKK